MKNINKLLVLLLVLLLTLAFPLAAFADENSLEISSDEEDELEEDELEEEEEELEEEDELEEDELEEGNGKEKPWKAEKQKLIQEKNDIEVLKDQLEENIESLELQLEEAQLNGDADKASALQAEIDLLKIQHDTYKADMKLKIELMQQVMKEKYTLEELEQLNEIAESMESLENIQVIPVENVFFNNGNIKFDVPPVIKEGRTLIPLRAISESMGADVKWNAEDKIATITKGEKIIEFNFTDNKIYINGVETPIDVTAEILNNRTMVPLRFIAENLEIEIEYDAETQTIEIN